MSDCFKTACIANIAGDCFAICDRRFDGSVDTPVAKGFGPDVSPDGKTLVFTKRG